MVVSVLAFCGDLVVSAVRFDLGVGGAEPLVPGRGLVLDRVRALSYTAPVLLHYLRYFLL